jgi:FMN phosphatase YigB (HAD superfamily)
LIIFDLDDTLIDTSGCITPVKLEMALDRMIEAGLPIGDPAAALELLRRLDAAADSARSTLSEFLEILGADEQGARAQSRPFDKSDAKQSRLNLEASSSFKEGDFQKFYHIGVAEVYGDLPDDIPVFPLDQAVEILTELKESHQLALVSIGKTEQQLSKMKKAGIDSTIFSKIIISESRDKKPHYQTIVEALGATPQETVVLGDRISLDLTPAKELGCKTIQMRWGRGLNPIPAPSKSDADFAITELKQIREILSLL